MKSPNVTYFRQSDLKYTKNDLKFGKNDLKYYDLKWDFPLGGLCLSSFGFEVDWYTFIILYTSRVVGKSRRQRFFAGYKGLGYEAWMKADIVNFLTLNF